jgi:hypothetical protein
MILRDTGKGGDLFRVLIHQKQMASLISGLGE